MSTRKTIRRAKATSSQSNEPAFPLDIWLENSKAMIGQPRYIVVGATYGKPDEYRYTRSEMRELVRRFLAGR